MSEWISVKDKAPLFPCIVCLESDSQPRIPQGIITCKLKNGETFYFDAELFNNDMFQFQKEHHCSFFTKENSINYWMPTPEPPKEERDE